MKTSFKHLSKSMLALLVSSVVLFSCTTTVKIPKHPAPGEPPKLPKVEIHKD